jgi:hypothetical protein
MTVLKARIAVRQVVTTAPSATDTSGFREGSSFALRLRKLATRSCGFALVVGVTGCGCPEWPCEPAVFLNAECATTKDCSLDGATVASCDVPDPDCPLWRLPPASILSIPLSKFWPMLRTRNDLRIEQNAWYAENRPGYPDLREAVFLLDNVTPEHCSRTRAEIRCDNVSEQVRQLVFSYGDAERVTARPILYIWMSDDECESSAEVCPK